MNKIFRQSRLPWDDDPEPLETDSHEKDRAIAPPPSKETPENADTVAATSPISASAEQHNSDSTVTSSYKGPVDNPTPADEIGSAAAEEPAPDSIRTDPNCQLSADLPVPEAGPVDLTGKTVWVIDSHSLIFQVFHAIPEMTSPQGEPVAAVFGFTRDIFHLLETKKPDYLFCAFDLPGATFRHEVYDAYKLQRSEMPVDLRPQIKQIYQVLQAMGIPQLSCDRCEADDILATLAYQTESLGGECYLVTGDKDCRQLITDRVFVYNIRKHQIFDHAALIKEWGITPTQVIDFQALVGDSVDNIPGVAGIGPKTAKDLLQKYTTLEAIFDHLDELPAGKQKQLRDGQDSAWMSRTLVELKKDLPITIDWHSGATASFEPRGALDLFQNFGFHSLATKVRGQQAAPKPTPAAPTKQQIVEFGTTEFEDFLQQLNRQTEIALSLVSTGHHRTAQVHGLAIAWDEASAEAASQANTDVGSSYAAYYLPNTTPNLFGALKPVLERPDLQKVGHDLKHDMVVLRTHGIDLAGIAFDTMLASYLINAGERNHTLLELAARLLGQNIAPMTELLGTGAQARSAGEFSPALLLPYVATQAQLPLQLRPLLQAQLQEMGLSKLHDELELPLIYSLAELEFNGIKLDLPLLESLSQRYGQFLLQLETEIYQLAGREFNIGSPKQLQEVLFVEQGLPVLKKTKTGASTDVEVLEELAKLHPLPEKIITYRQFAKLKNTYVDALPQLAIPDTARVHATFNQVVAATGRLSCTDPNLQNIPVRTESGREIRSAFLPGASDWRLLAADYSQIELRVLAHYSQDPALVESFARDEDIHARVASQVYGVPLEEVTSAMRRVAKAVNFGVIYGQSPFGLAKAIDISQTEAAEFIQAYFSQYPGVEVFLEQILANCRQDGYVSTILGRRRAIRGVRDRQAVRDRDLVHQRTLPERTAINTVIQGSAADLIKMAMLKVYRRLENDRLQARMLLQIHDELMFEAPESELSTLGKLVVEEMTQVLPLEVPLKVDVKSGTTWADCEPW